MGSLDELKAAYQKGKKEGAEHANRTHLLPRPWEDVKREAHNVAKSYYPTYRTFKTADLRDWYEQGWIVGYLAVKEAQLERA